MRKANAVTDEAGQGLGGGSKLDVYLERAAKAREARKAAPSVDVKGLLTIPQKDHIARLAKAEGGVDKKMHRIFVGRDMLAQYADMGYAPVMEHGDLVTVPGGDVMVEIPVKFYHESLAAVSALSKTRLGERTKQDAAAAAKGVGAGETVSYTNVKAADLEKAAQVAG